MQNDNFNVYFILNIIANLLQIADYQMNVSQLSNDDLMKELQKQDQVLDEQTNSYLKRIVENQEKILEILTKLGSNE